MPLKFEEFPHGSIELDAQNADVRPARGGSREAAVDNDGLLALMALLGAVYGWVLVLLFGVVAVIVILIG